MPGLDGYGLTSAIRHEEGGARRMPILALTANAMQGEANLSAKNGTFSQKLERLYHSQA